MSQDNNQNLNSNPNTPPANYPNPYQNVAPAHSNQYPEPSSNSPYNQPNSQYPSQPNQPYSPFNQTEIYNNPFSTVNQNPFSNQPPESNPILHTDPFPQPVNTPQIPDTQNIAQPKDASFSHLNEIYQHPNTSDSQKTTDTSAKNPTQPKQNDTKNKKIKKSSGFGGVIAIFLIVILLGTVAGVGYFAYTFNIENGELKTKISELENQKAPITLQNTIERLEAEKKQAQMDLANIQQINTDQAAQIASLEKITGQTTKSISLEEAQKIALSKFQEATVTNSKETTEFGSKWLIEVSTTEPQNSRITVLNIFLSATGDILHIVIISTQEPTASTSTTN